MLTPLFILPLLIALLCLALDRRVPTRRLGITAAAALLVCSAGLLVARMQGQLPLVLINRTWMALDDRTIPILLVLDLANWLFVLLARTIEVGGLPRAAAEQFGVRGPLARASGIARDARSDHPYAGYSRLAFKPITQDGGDVYARLMLLLLEAYESVKLIEQALKELAEGQSHGELPEELPVGQGASAVEGPHGLIRYVVESDGRRLTRVRIDTPRQLDRLLARTLLSDALIDNAVAIIASTDPCTACAER
jgi:Ni,Fe-hydrogenase III large subunit